MTLIIPGTWIEPVDPNMTWQGPSFFGGPPSFLSVPRKPYFCEGLITTEYECSSCRNNGGVWLEVKGFPLIAFCPTHWQSIRPSSAVADLKELLGVS